MLSKSMRYALYAAPVVLSFLGCQSPGLTVSALDPQGRSTARRPDVRREAADGTRHRISGNQAAQLPVANRRRSAELNALAPAEAASSSRPIIIRTSDETTGDRTAKVNTASPSNDPADLEGGTRTVPRPLPPITEEAKPLKTNSAADQAPVGNPLDDDLLLDAFPDQSESDADAGKFRSKSSQQAAQTENSPSKGTVEEQAATEKNTTEAPPAPPATGTAEKEEVPPSLIWDEKQKPAPTTAGRLSKRETGKNIVEAIARKLHGAELNDYDLTIEFRNGVATLKGQVTYPEQKLAATHLTALVPGVKRVDNQLSPVRGSIAQQPTGPTIGIDPLPTDGKVPTAPNKKSAFDLTNLRPNGAENEPDASPKAESPQSASDAANDSAKTAAAEKRPRNVFPGLAEEVDPSQSPSIAAKPDSADPKEATAGVEAELMNPFPDLSEKEADQPAKIIAQEQAADAPSDPVQTADTDSKVPSSAAADDLPSPFPDLSEEEADRPPPRRRSRT